MVKVIVAETKHDCEHLLGQFVDESSYDVLIEEDTDCYLPSGTMGDGQPSEATIAFKFRKNYFTEKEQDLAYKGLREAAVETQNRGTAAGPKSGTLGNREWVTEYQFEIMDYFLKPGENLFGEDPVQLIMEKYGEDRSSAASSRGQVWSINRTKDEGFVFDNWVEEVRAMAPDDATKETKRVLKELVCSTTYANSVFSGIAGFFDRYPRIPYGRATSYTEHNREKYEMAFPFLQHLSEGFSQLLPVRYNAQKAAANTIDPRFVIPGTPFTTVTVNKTFRTACHRDAGDFQDGLSNLLVLSNNGNYEGGYLVFPEVRVAVNVRPGDLLLVNNHEIIHGNTEMKMLDDEAERISLVVYLREKMLELGSWEYEQTRKSYVDDRRLNKEHPLWKPLWNGVSEGMWKDKEWYDYLESKLGADAVQEYHPEAVQSSLEDFFS